MSVLIYIMRVEHLTVNGYIDMKTEFKIVVYFILFSHAPGKIVCTHGSELPGAQIFPSSFVL